MEKTSSENDCFIFSNIYQNNDNIGSGFPPISGKMPQTSGSSDWPKIGPSYGVYMYRPDGCSLLTQIWVCSTSHSQGYSMITGSPRFNIYFIRVGEMIIGGIYTYSVSLVC